MDKTPIYAAIVLVLAFLSLNVLESMVEGPEAAEGSCFSSLDCEGLPHAECVGGWECQDNVCVWECDTSGPDGDDGGTGAECRVDRDCMITGCSDQICSPEPVITTCEFKREYECLRSSNCRCIGGRCGWEETESYLSCMENI